MPAKNPDKRTAKRLEKLEREKQAKKVKICQYRMKGLSYRDIGRKVGMSHQAVSDICRKLLKVVKPARKIVKRGPRGGKITVTEKEKLEFRKGFKKLLPSEKPGPKPGNTPKCDEIEATVVKVRKKYNFLGAEKIGIIAGVDASAPTVRKTLNRCGYGNITEKKGQARKRFCSPYPNHMWQIDYVDLGAGTHLLSVLDDHSRKILSKNLRHTFTTDDVLEIMAETIGKYGKPEIILSDHGCQWYSVLGGDARFDSFCEEQGIKHYMGGIRKPTTQGKVERWHGTIRRETDIDRTDDIEEKRAILYEYMDFYNSVRPHYAVGLRTPDEVYYKTDLPESDPVKLYLQ